MSNLDKLPDWAFLDNRKMERAQTPAPVLGIIKGESGFHPIYTRKSADELNKAFGVTKAQVEAMYIGSLFSWDVPGADPDSYNEDGSLK